MSFEDRYICFHNTVGNSVVLLVDTQVIKLEYHIPSAKFSETRDLYFLYYYL